MREFKVNETFILLTRVALMRIFGADHDKPTLIWKFY